MTRRVAHVLLGVLGFLLASEALLRLLPVYSATDSGYHVDPLVLNYPAHHEWQVSTGWALYNPQRMRANNAGFAAEHDFVPDPQAVALVGDSYVEASMLPMAQRPAAQLEQALGGQRRVYAMGGPGSSLLDYAERIRLAHERWGVRDFVVLLERGDVRQALCGSGNVHARCLDRRTLEPRTELQPPASTLKRWLRHSALMQYLNSQLKVDFQRLPAQAFPELLPAPSGGGGTGPAWPPGGPKGVAEAVARAFFERIGPHVTGRLVLVADSDRKRLERGEEPDLPDRAHFIQLARAAGITVVDAEPMLRQHYQRSSLSLNVGPYDAHLNALGVKMLTQAAAAALQGDAP
jgi:hypothetical protein